MFVDSKQGLRRKEQIHFQERKECFVSKDSKEGQSFTTSVNK